MRPGPLTPIFDPAIKRGSINAGSTPISSRVRRVGAALETDSAGTIAAQIVQFGSWAYSTGSGVNQSSTLFWPSTPVAGDIALLYLTRSNTATFPSAGNGNPITDFGSPAHQGGKGAVYTRLCDGSETLSGYTITIGGSASNVCIIILIKGLSGLTEVGFATQSDVSSPTDITYPTITPSAQPSLIFYTGHGGPTNTSGTPVNPGGSNPTPALLTASAAPPPAPGNQPRCAIFVGRCTSTSALGNRTVAETGLDANFYHGMTFGISAA